MATRNDITGDLIATRQITDSYRDNFDEFGSLREDHSPWTAYDLLIAAVCVGVLLH